MTAQELNDRLQTERIVVLADVAWAELEDSYDEVECHDTIVAGDLLIVRTDAGLAAVEKRGARHPPPWWH